jgi:putative ABC transport system substrate-binding protein
VRKVLAGIVTLAVLMGPVSADAQQAARGARVGILVPGTPSLWDGYIQVLRVRLGELGWLEGQNLILDLRYANDRYDRLPALAAELVALKPNAIFASSAAATLVAARATTAIPIVFETLGDAVDLGLVSNLARLDRNVIGVSGFSPQLSAKRLELIREIVPGVRRVGVLANLANPVTRPVVRAIEAAVRDLPV